MRIAQQGIACAGEEPSCPSPPTQLAAFKKTHTRVFLGRRQDEVHTILGAVINGYT